MGVHGAKIMGKMDGKLEEQDEGHQGTGYGAPRLAFHGRIHYLSTGFGRSQRPAAPRLPGGALI